MARKAGRHGWTLIKLVVGIAVAAILASFAIPTYRIDATRLDAAVRRVQSDIRYAQQLSMSTRRHTWVAFDTATDVYRMWIEDPAQLGKANRIAVTDPVDRAAFEVTLGVGEYSGVGLVSANFDSSTELEFDSIGTPMDGNSVALSSAGSVTLSGGRQVVVEPNSGAVSAP